jgi:5'-deoxynucleotidase YfbR-like HD superfamily hydrolase
MADPVGLYRELTALRHIKRFQQHGILAPISVAEHSFYVAILGAVYARQLQQEGVPVDVAAVIEAGLWHDAPEAVLGDTPHPVHRRWPAIGQAVSTAENEVYRRYIELAGLPPTSQIEAGSLEALLVKLADWAELVLFEAEERLMGNRSIQRASEKIIQALDGTLRTAFEALRDPAVLAWYDRVVTDLKARTLVEALDAATWRSHVFGDLSA